ncbi:MAG: D-amino acid aminotransferase [Pseudomonadota bacterium]
MTAPAQDAPAPDDQAERALTAHDSEIDARNDAILIHVDGRLVPKAEAMVSVYDSGFMLGDGVWEGLRLHAGRWAFLDAHLDRLYEAAKAIDLDIGLDREALTAALEETRAVNGMEDDAHARLMVTRGRKIRPFQHPSLSRWGPTVVIIMEHSRPLPELAERGVTLATVPQVRGLPMSQDPKLNSHSKLNCVLAAVQAEKAGADEGLMLDPLGFVNTTNSCNFFIVRRGEVWTSTGNYCMNGITRGKTIELCRQDGIPVFERDFSLVETYGADEAFLTGSFGGHTPVREIDGRPIGEGGAGPVTRRIRELYRALVRGHAD